jgi:hypothetical protein
LKVALLPQFIVDYRTSDDAIDWERVVAFNSATEKPGKVKKAK